MRAIYMLLVAVLVLVAVPAGAESRTPPTLFGEWSVDLARLPIPPQARPKKVTIKFAPSGNGGLATRVEVIRADDERTSVEGTTSLDGTPSAVQGNLEADVSATTMPAPGVLVMQLAKGGAPASTRIYTVIEDGKSMIETVASYSADGRPALRTNHFTRVR